MYSLKPKASSGSHTEHSTPQASSGVPLIFLASVPIFALLMLGAVLFLSYTQAIARGKLEDRIAFLERRVAQDGDAIYDGQKNATALASDINVVTKKAGITDQELSKARGEAEQFRAEAERKRRELEAANEQQDKRLAEAQDGLTKGQSELAKQLDTKAGRTDVANVAGDVARARAEAADRAAEVQRIADTKINAVQGDVRNVQGDVRNVASNLDATKKDVAANQRDLVDAKNVLNQQIAKNASELGDLRRKGERQFFDIDITKDKKNPMSRIADIQLGLQDTDIKNRRYGIIVQVDDNRLEKKDQLVNQPIQFLVGKERLRYELVVNSVEKDRIRGYLSVPLDKALSAERPTGR